MFYFQASDSVRVDTASAVAVIENKNAVLAAECIAVTTLISIVTIPVIAMLISAFYGL